MTDSRSGGTGFFGVLTIVFIVLKLVGTIDWSWTLVLSPLWIPLAVAGIVIVFIAIFHAKKSITNSRRRKKRYGF